MERTYSLSALPGRTALINGEEWLYFSGTAYLGIVQDEYFKSLVRKGVELFGVHYGGSRLSLPQVAIYREAEHQLAKLGQAEAALTVTSGTLAGRLALQYFNSSQYIKCHAPGAHPAIQETATAFYDSWLDEIFNLNAEGKTLVILTNHIDPLFVTKSDFSWIDQIASDQNIILVVDDSHGFGINGVEGGGISTSLELPDNVSLVVVSSLGKALGIPGGVILGPKEIIRALWKLPMFGGASPVSPAYLYAFTKAQELYREKRVQLLHNVRFFNKIRPKAIPLQSFDEFPVFYTQEDDLSAFLQEHKVLISSFKYPTADDDLVTRIVLNSLHSENDIECLVELLEKFAKVQSI